MKKYRMLSGMLLLLLCCLCGCKKEGGSTGQVYRVIADYEELDALLAAPAEDMVLLDLRDNKAYEKVHLAGSINVPYDDDGTWLLQCVEKHSWKESAIYLICGSGKRSAAAFNLLVEQGIPRVFCISFGYEAYLASQGYGTSEGAEACDCY